MPSEQPGPDEKSQQVPQWSVYLVRMASGNLYCGISTDVERRFREHCSSAKGARALRGKGPLSLVFSEVVGNRSDASKVEYQIKQLTKREKEKLVTGKRSLPDFSG